MVETQKKLYNGRYFEEHVNNSKKVWEGINKIINKKNKNSEDDIFLDENGIIITDQQKVANKSNDFFINIAQNLVDKIVKANNKYQDFLKNPNKHSTFLMKY